jgi:hypothetical protein
MITMLDIQPSTVLGKQGETLFHVPIEDVDSNITDRLSPDGLQSTLDRMNNYKDDRSKVLLAALACEAVQEKFLTIIFPRYRKIFDDDRDMTFSMKTKMLKAIAIIPFHFTEASDIVRSVRNRFAHDLTIEKLDDLPEKIKKTMRQYYAQRGVNPRKKVDDIHHVFNVIAHIATQSLSRYLPLVKDLNKAIRAPSFEKKIRKAAQKRQHEQMAKLLNHMNAPASDENPLLPY